MSSRMRRTQAMMIPAVPFLMIALATWSNSVRGGGPGDDKTPVAKDANAGAVVISMQKCNASRRGRFGVTEDDDEEQGGEKKTKSIFDFAMPKDVPLIRKGTLTVDGEAVTIYLPKAKRYGVENTGRGDEHHSNKSTLLSIDADHNGKLGDDESWFANLPIRVADRMFEITRIAEDGSEIELRPSSAPLRGVIVGRKCPAFSYKTSDGRLITQDTYKGKAFLLDVWSVT